MILSRTTTNTACETFIRCQSWLPSITPMGKFSNCILKMLVGFRILSLLDFEGPRALLWRPPWIRIRQGIDYKISTLIFESLLGHSLSYLPFTSAAHIPGRRDQQPEAPLSNHQPHVRPWMAGIRLYCWNRLPLITNTDPVGFHSNFLQGKLPSILKWF